MAAYIRSLARIATRVSRPSATFVARQGTVLYLLSSLETKKNNPGLSPHSDRASHKTQLD